MIKFFRKIRQRLLTENKFSKYLLYAIGEIILVVVGILIALKINNWNSLKIKAKEGIQTYQQIKRQIFEDQKELIQTRGLNNNHSIQFSRAIQIIELKLTHLLY